MAFLEHAEYDRGNSARTRNAWLAAIRAFFRYIEYRVPACLDLALRVRSVPPKRTDTTLIDYLTRVEITALLDAPDPRKRLGTRDRAMLHLAYAAGLRVAELLSLQLQDLPERSLATIHIMGKGRRERVLPLWRETQTVLRHWLAIRPQCRVTELFLNASGEPRRSISPHRAGSGRRRLRPDVTDRRPFRSQLIVPIQRRIRCLPTT